MLLHTVCAVAFALTAQTVTPAALPPARATDAPAADASRHAAAPLDSSDRPITHFFQNLGRDLASLPSARTASILLAGGGASIFLHPLDDRVHTWVVKQPESNLASIGNAGGGVWAQDVSALAIWGIGAASGHTKIAHVGADLIRAQALVTVLVVPTKMIVNRERPNGSHRSFPSGHASASFATAAVLGEHFGWKAGVPAYALAGVAAWSRVRSDNHWLSDVAFGASVGLIAGTTVSAGHRQAWAIVPTRTAGGLAIYLVRVAR